MKKTERIENLLKENKKVLLNNAENNGICSDGIIDEKKFCGLAFLLKETNGDDSKGKIPNKLDDWPYADWLRTKQAVSLENGGEALYRTFYNVCMWVDEYKASLKGEYKDFSEYAPSGAVDSEKIRHNLLEIAVVNLKKTWGGGATAWNDLNAYISDNKIRNIINEEMEIIEPKLVVCGGQQVFDFAKSVFGNDKVEVTEVATVNDFTLKYFTVGKTRYINFMHPACRKSRKNMYDYANDVFAALAKMN